MSFACRNIETKTKNEMNIILSRVTISEWELVQMGAHAHAYSLIVIKLCVCARIAAATPKEVEHLMATDMILIRRAVTQFLSKSPQSQISRFAMCLPLFFLVWCSVNLDKERARFSITTIILAAFYFSNA